MKLDREHKGTHAGLLGPQSSMGERRRHRDGFSALQRLQHFVREKVEVREEELLLRVPLSVEAR